MGIFGSSPQKKLEKARLLLEHGSHFEALRLFEDAVESGRLAAGDRTAAIDGARTCRKAMIQQRLEEAELLRRAGDLEGARDRCATALDLAGDDLPREQIEELLRKINAPRRPTAPTGRLAEDLEDDLLPEPDRVAIRVPTPVDRAPAETPPPTDEELFGDAPETLFEIHLHTIDQETARIYRTLGVDFRLGYLALSQGAGKRALEFFDRLDWGAISDPSARLERSHALLLAGRGEDALESLLQQRAEVGEAGNGSGREADLARRTAYLTVEALRLLHRSDEAVEAARGLHLARPDDPAALVLLGWTLLEDGRASEALALLNERIEAGEDGDEVLVAAASACALLGAVDREVELLERLLERRMASSAAAGQEIDFPVETGRRLLDLYLRTDKEKVAVRGLAMHLIDHDPERGEAYREILLSLGGR